ncbi:MAG: hypothetical protein A3C07_03905 [Candidatus Sungbacteria bacterium RIFCSPHIGHO2_02_FULL_47_11]|uniref:Uncharacterized protein n=1 Tax=Candidatus Sungbacteria bacterium RIFCSPHIGHO2_02_FULL_47_11 TaxID=1802270 RepID=A0A1G2KGQ4_9BACT|nr:MAG: hypothetical protein A3C07_03905 [Candidatus Sungbacteria bacterium RIFCSPHIGHO2_02_FULL_47_11]
MSEIKAPLEYRIAIEIFEDCFPAYFCPLNPGWDRLTLNDVHLLICGFVIGRGYAWRTIRFGNVVAILGGMVDSCTVKSEDTDLHLRKPFSAFFFAQVAL